VPFGPTGLNGCPRKRPKPPGCAVDGASAIGFANFRSISISAHTYVVAGSMYPPKIRGLIGSPRIDASIEA
jgi:hypothetical protein